MTARPKTKKTRTSDLNVKLIKPASKVRWGKHLAFLIESNEMTQSQVAASIWGRNENSKVRAARNRDLISCYVKGTVFPNMETLKKLCNALRVTMEQLVPSDMRVGENSGLKPFDFTMIESMPDNCLVEWHEVIPTSLAQVLFALRVEWKKSGRSPILSEGKIIFPQPNEEQP